MNHKEILAKWVGKNYAESPELWYQCVWWVKKYYQEKDIWLNSFWGSAITGWITESPFGREWKKVKYTWFNSPSEWDVIFWSEARCKFGHTAIANKFCNPLVLRYSDQNGLWRWDKIQNRWGTYKNVLWWFTRI